MIGKKCTKLEWPQFCQSLSTPQTFNVVFLVKSFSGLPNWGEELLVNIMSSQFIEAKALSGGFTVRQAELADAEAITHLINLCDLETLGRKEHSVAKLLSEWQAPNFELSQSRVVIADDGNIAAYAELWYSIVPVRNYVWGRVHPAYRNRGIGTFIMNWGEEMARAAVEAKPPNEKPCLLASCVDSETAVKQLFQNHHLELNRRYFTMLIELDKEPPTPTWPDNIHLTTFTEFGDLSAVWRANNEAFRDHYGHVERPEEDGIKSWQHIIDTAEHYDPDLWFLAMDGDEVAGLCLCTPRTNEDPEKAHVNNLAVRRPWRKQGLGMALLHHAFGEFYKRGRKRADLGVDATSLTGATRLYERAGMHQTDVYVSYQKPLES